MRRRGGSRSSWRKRLRVAFWIVVVVAPAVLAIEDLVSQRGLRSKAGTRVVTVNVNTRPDDVAARLRPLDPDIVFMQETALPCRAAGERLGLEWQDGEDQCLLSRWRTKPLPVEWHGPWGRPQLARIEHPEAGSIALVNVRLAMPEAVAALAGQQWYTEGQRRSQYPALRQLLADASPAIVCGDFNALPLEVDLGREFGDVWSGLRYGATFPARLPAARIDQCWVSSTVEVAASWTLAVPSDHRALVADVRVRRR